MAASDLIVREAGGIVTDYNAGHSYLKAGHIVAGAPRVLKEILNKIQPCLVDDLK